MPENQITHRQYVERQIGSMSYLLRDGVQMLSDLWEKVRVNKEKLRSIKALAMAVLSAIGGLSLRTQETN